MNMYNSLVDIYKTTIGSIDEWLQDHPKIKVVIEGAIEDIHTLFKAIFTGQYSLLKETNTGKFVSSVFDTIKNIGKSWWFKPFILIFDTVKSIAKVAFDHPILTGIVYGLSETMFGIDKLIDIVWPVKGTFLQKLFGAGIAFGIQKTTDSFSNIFSGRNDKYMSFMKKEKERMYDLIQTH